MRARKPMHTEAAKIRRGYYIVTLIFVTIFTSVFIASHFAIVKQQNDAALARLEDTALQMTKGFLRDSIDRTIAAIDLERRLVREELGIRPGDAEGERRADGIARERMIPRIRETRLSGDGYIWVHEILDFDGGPGYARRLVHRFLRDTEGSLLSTDTEDAGGNYPYLTELEGVKKDGDVFTTYYFAKPGEQLPSLKLSYACLYPDFSWVVATGVYLDDVHRIIEYEKRISEVNRKSQTTSSVSGFVIALVGVLFIIAVVDRVTSKAINEGYERILATEQALRDEKRKVEDAYALMKDLAERDELTGLRNRRSGLNRLAIEAARAKRSSEPFCVAIGDIDRFKAFNDRYGHDTGDLVLKAVSEAIEGGVRVEDMAARWGGEEFLLLLSGDGLAEAVEATDRIRAAVAARTLSAKGEELRVTMTLGVAEFAQDETLEALIARADAAMYKGKAAGRDTVVAAPPPDRS